MLPMGTFLVSGIGTGLGTLFNTFFSHEKINKQIQSNKLARIRPKRLNL